MEITQILPVNLIRRLCKFTIEPAKCTMQIFIKRNSLAGPSPLRESSVGRHNSLEKEEVAMVGLLNRERWLNISTPEHRWHLDKMNPLDELAKRTRRPCFGFAGAARWPPAADLVRLAFFPTSSAWCHKVFCRPRAS